MKLSIFVFPSYKTEKVGKYDMEFCFLQRFPAIVVIRILFMKVQYFFGFPVARKLFFGYTLIVYGRDFPVYTNGNHVV